MTAQSSMNRTFKYFVYRLGRLKYMIILLFLFAFMTFPLYSVFLEGYAAESLSTEWEPYTTGTYEALCNDLGWKIFAAGVAGSLIVMFIMLLGSFRYLHSKDHVNMDLSLPVTHTQRFFGELLAVVTAQFVPILAACGIGALTAAHVRSLNYSYFYPNGGVPQYLWHCSTIESLIPQFIVAAVMLFAMSLFVISFCGRTHIAIIMTVLVQIAVPLTTFCLWIIALKGANGANDNSLMDTSIMSLLSPVGYLFSYGIGAMHYLLNSSPFGYIFITVYVIALIAGSYFVQKHRSPERTGDPFVYKYARHGFTALYIMAVTAFFGMRIFSPDYAKYTFFYTIVGGGTSERYDTAFVIISVIASAAVFVVMELIGGGSVKKIPASAVRYVVTVGVCFGICALMPLTEGFGYSTYIPSAENADTARINIHYYYDFMSGSISYEDAVKLHKRIIDEQTGVISENQSRSRARVDLDYFKGGAYSNKYAAARTYYLDESYIEDLYKMYFRNGGFANYYEPLETPRQTYRNDNGQWITYELEKTKDFAFVWTTSTPPDGEEEQEKYMIKSDVDTDELYNTLVEEARSVTFEQIYLSAYAPKKKIYIRRKYSYKPNDEGVGAAQISSYDYDVYPFYTKTLALLKEHGIDLFPDNEKDYTGYTAFLIKVTDSEPRARVETVDSVYVDLVDLCSDPEREGIRRLSDNTDELTELMSYIAEKSYYKNNERYYIWLTDSSYGQNGNDRYYPVTEANTARAAEIWSGLPDAEEELEKLHDR